MNGFIEVTKETPSLQINADVLAAAVELSYRWKIDFDWTIVDPSVTLLADFWEKTLKATNGFALKHMPFNIQIQHADTVQGTIQLFEQYQLNSIRPLVARELWSNQSFCIEWLLRGSGYCKGMIDLIPLIPPGAWSDRSFCLALAQQRHKYKAEPLIPPHTLRPLIAPALWYDLPFCMEWAKHMTDTADKLKPLIPDEIWSNESFCVMRAKHIEGEVNTLIESFPLYKTDREFWFSLFSGRTIWSSVVDTFREASKQAPAFCEDAELMIVALRWRIDGRTMFGGAVAPSLFEDPDFFRLALQLSQCTVLEVVSHDLQRRFLELILECFSRHPPRLIKTVWSYLAADLREHRPMCAHWISARLGTIDTSRTM